MRDDTIRKIEQVIGSHTVGYNNTPGKRLASAKLIYELVEAEALAKFEKRISDLEKKGVKK